MGKSRVKGITIQIGGDTMGLDKALQSVNKQANNTQNQLKDVERLLKLDPKNTVLLEQKQRLLAESISTTKDKLDALNQASDSVKDSMGNYDAFRDAFTPIQEQIDTTNKKLKDLKAQQKELEDCGEIDTEAYQTLTEEIQNTSKELRDLKKQAKAVSDEFGNPISPEQYDALQREIIETERQLGNLADDAQKTQKKLDGLEDEVRDVADAMDDVSEKTSTFGDVLKAEAIVAGATGIVSSLKDVASETKEYRKIMGSLEVSSGAAGYSAEQTQDAYKRLYGVLADEQSAATTMANLQALGLSQEQLMAAIDNSIGGWAKYGDSIPIDGLAEAINETTKAGTVTGTLADILNWGAAEGETYGVAMREATEANEAWNEAVAACKTAEDFFNLALQECTTEAERADLILQTMANQGLAAAAEKWRENNASMVEANETNAELQEQMALLGEKMEPLMTKITGCIVAALDWFNNLDPAMQNFILILVALVAAVGPVVGAIGGISSVVGKLAGTELPGLGAAMGTISGNILPGLQGAFSSIFGFIAANPVVLLIGAIVGLVALIATKGDEIQAILQRVDEFLQTIFAQDWTEVFGPILGGVLNDFLAVAKGIWDSIKQILDGVIDFICGIFTGDWERAWQGVVGIFEGIFSGLGAILKAPINSVIDLLNDAIDSINWLIDGANQLPSVDIPTIGKIPYLAEGGEVIQGQAMVGENGPEIMTVLPDRTVVQPLTSHTYHTTRSVGMVHISVYAAPGQDVRELAELVAEEMQQMVDEEEAGIQ